MGKKSKARVMTTSLLHRTRRDVNVEAVNGSTCLHPFVLRT